LSAGGVEFSIPMGWIDKPLTANKHASTRVSVRVCEHDKSKLETKTSPRK